MSDLISRQAAIEALQKEINKGKPPFDDVIGSIRCGVRLARNIIEDLPSAEALTNVQNMHKGKWIKKQVFNPELDKYVPLIECSVCGYEPYFGGSESRFNYCANCGARMKGGDSE